MHSDKGPVCNYSDVARNIDAIDLFYAFAMRRLSHELAAKGYVQICARHMFAYHILARIMSRVQTTLKKRQIAAPPVFCAYDKLW